MNTTARKSINKARDFGRSIEHARCQRIKNYVEYVRSSERSQNNSRRATTQHWPNSLSTTTSLNIHSVITSNRDRSTKGISSRGKANSRKGKGHRGKGIKARSGGYGGNLSRSVIYTYIKAKEGPVNVVPWDLRGLGILRTRHMKGGYFPELLIYFSRIVF